MPFVLPSDPVTGQIAPVTWGDAVRDALNYLANPPACRVYNNAALSHTSTGNWQVLSGLNSERYDTDTMHSTVTNTGRITINTAGVYELFGCIEFAANATGIRGIRLAINGNTATGDIASNYWPSNGAVIGTALSISSIWKFAVGEYVEVAAFQNSGGNLAIQRLDSASPEFAATWIGLG